MLIRRHLSLNSSDYSRKSRPDVVIPLLDDDRMRFIHFDESDVASFFNAMAFCDGIVSSLEHTMQEHNIHYSNPFERHRYSFEDGNLSFNLWLWRGWITYGYAMLAIVTVKRFVEQFGQENSALACIVVIEDTLPQHPAPLDVGRGYLRVLDFDVAVSLF